MPVGSGSFAGGSPSISVQALLKQPVRVSRDLANLVYQRLVADKLLVTGSPDQVRGGAMQYQRAESIFVDAPIDVEEIAQHADWPRATWSEALRTQAVKQYGLEVEIDNLAIRRNQIDRVTRGERKLANNLVRFIDTQAMALLSDPTQGINTQVSAAAWSTNTTDIIAEVAKAEEAIENQNNGYNGFEGATLVLPLIHRKSLLNNTVLRAALPRENTDGQIQSGMMAPFLGVKEILFTPQLSGVALVVDSGQAGLIADEEPDPQEGFVAYDPGSMFKPIYVKIYEEPRPKGKVIAAGRWPAMALTDPGAVTLITGI